MKSNMLLCLTSSNKHTNSREVHHLSQYIIDIARETPTYIVASESLGQTCTVTGEDNGLVSRQRHSTQFSHITCTYTIVLCKYSKYRIELNSLFSIRFNSKRAQLFEIFEYLPSPISYLFIGMKPIFHLSNHA